MSYRFQIEHTDGRASYFIHPSDGSAFKVEDSAFAQGFAEGLRQMGPNWNVPTWHTITVVDDNGHTVEPERGGRITMVETTPGYPRPAHTATLKMRRDDGYFLCNGPEAIRAEVESAQKDKRLASFDYIRGVTDTVPIQVNMADVATIEYKPKAEW